MYFIESDMFSYRRFIYLWVTILLFGVIGTANTLEAQSKRGGKIVFGETNSVRRFNPYDLSALKADAIRLFSLIYEGLVRYDYYEEEFFPDLAESWEYNADSLSIVMHLRRDVTWHDGVPFTARDVAFTYRYIASPLTPPEIRGQYSAIAGVRAVDDYTIKATFSRAVLHPENYFKAWIIPSHRFKDDLLDADDGESLDIHPIGTGPYVFDRQTLEGHIHMYAFEDYWGEPANILEVTRNRVTDPQQIIIGATAADFYHLIRYLHPDDFSAVTASKKFEIKAYPSLSIHALAHNNAHPLLKNKLVRQAITLGTNRAGMLQQWYGGQGEVLAGPYNNQTSYAPPNLEPYEYNPDRASTLLETNGYVDRDEDGIRESPDGVLMSLSLLVVVEQVARETINQQLAASFASEMREIGIDVRVENMSGDEWRRRVFETSDYDIALIEWVFDPNYDISDLFSSQHVEGNNVVRYQSAEADYLIEQLTSLQDPEQRRQTAYRLQSVLREDCPYTFLFSIDKHAAIHRRIFFPEISPYYFFSYFPEWYIPADYR